jgi:hypothetical protein
MRVCCEGELSPACFLMTTRCGYFLFIPHFVQFASDAEYIETS